jgi:hypothetical protein
MKKLFLCLVAISCACIASAQQPTDGTPYFLPKTGLRFTARVEKTVYTPGEYAEYAGIYLKRGDVSLNGSTKYRLLKLEMTSVGVPDSSKMFAAKVNPKYNINKVNVSESGILLAVNADPKEIAAPQPFVPAPKPARLNPHDYMSEDILSAGNRTKTAELCAKEIYDIRDSRKELIKGQADNMPKDGEQLKIMLKQLDMQESALLQLFEGITDVDTTEVTFTYVPEREVNKYLLFRFSQKLGLVDADDLSGIPYYISIEDEHSLPSEPVDAKEKKKDKDDPEICVNVPSKAKVNLYKEETLWGSYEFYAAQFGRVDSIGAALFDKKHLTKLVLNPITGNIEKIDSEPVK